MKKLVPGEKQYRIVIISLAIIFNFVEYFIYKVTPLVLLMEIVSIYLAPKIINLFSPDIFFSKDGIYIKNSLEFSWDEIVVKQEFSRLTVGGSHILRICSNKHKDKRLSLAVTWFTSENLYKLISEFSPPNNPMRQILKE